MLTAKNLHAFVESDSVLLVIVHSTGKCIFWKKYGAGDKRKNRFLFLKLFLYFFRETTYTLVSPQ